MNPTLGVFVLMNNYFHDVATALLLATSISVWVLASKYGEGERIEVTRYFLKVYDSLTKLAKFALYWVLLAGIPRIYFYMDLEWSHAVGKGQIPAIIVKHILMVVIVGTGAHMWIRLSRKVRKLKGTLEILEGTAGP